MTRSELREKCMAILYQINIYEERKIIYDVNKIIKENLTIENKFVNEIVHGVLLNQTIIDTMANKFMEGWTINRIDKTGSSILRIAIYELKYMDTPKIVAINEAIELAKKYSDEPVRKIINATLDKIIRNEEE